MNEEREVGGNILFRYKCQLVNDLFVRTADENYITARWCVTNRLYVDFFWLSLHCIEKYLKAIILLHDESSKKYRHNVIKLFTRVCVIIKPIKIDKIQKPELLLTKDWIYNSTIQYLEHLQKFGNPHNRYLTFGYVHLAEDLHMLDQLIFRIRRCIWLFEHYPKQNSDDDGWHSAYCNELIKDEKFCANLNLPLDRLLSQKEPSDVQKALLNVNTAFAPIGFNHTSIRSGLSAHNPPIGYCILEPLAGDDPKRATIHLQLAKWTLENVELPKGSKGDPGVVEQIQEAIDAAKLKHGLP